MWLSKYNALWVYNGLEVNNLVSIDTTGEINGGKKYITFTWKKIVIANQEILIDWISIK